MTTAKKASHSSSTTLTARDDIIAWAEQRGGQPARVKGTGEGDEDRGILRFDFGEPDERLEPIDWDTFFTIFEERDLALLIQDHTADGKVSRFNKLISRSGEE